MTETFFPLVCHLSFVFAFCVCLFCVRATGAWGVATKTYVEVLYTHVNFRWVKELLIKIETISI